MDKTIEKTGNWFVDQLSLYQSANSNNASIRKNFVIRQAEFDLIISDLANKQPADPLQHELILGRRGSGKSTLLKRIQVDIEENTDLQKKYIAINLAEEQAGIYRLFDLWEEVWKELTHIYKLDKILKPYDDFEDDTAFTRYLYAQIHQTLARQQKKLVLLLDNFDRIADNFTDDGHLLRETLLNHNDVQLIAGSTRMDEHFWRYDKPFYEFFRRHRLEALDITEIVQLLNHWATVMQLPALAQFTRTGLGKLEAIRILTDGLPRTLQFFIQLLLQNDALHGYDYLRKIMDNVTPLYQERLNSLPAAHRKIVAEMAFIWEACGVKELVDKCRMESKLISAHIKQLANQGMVDTIGTGKKNHLYRLSERFFNMWLMITQGNPAQKRKAKWLSIFLETWYDAEELRVLATEHIDKLKDKKLGYDKALVMAKAFAQSKYITARQRDEILDLTNQLNEDQEPYGYLQLPRKAVEIKIEIEQLIEKQQFDKALVLADEIENEAGGFKYAVKAFIYAETNNFIEAEKYYLLAIEQGYADAMYNLGVLYARQGKVSDAEKYFLRAIEQGDAKAMNNLAVLYDSQGKVSEAEKYYLLAIEQGHANAMYNLGLLYDSQGKVSGAEKYYLRAIEQGDADAMNNLGLLYARQGKVSDAEKYFLRAIEQGHTNAMCNLGLLYADEGRVSDAEKYYLLAIEQGHTGAMYNLGLLYDDEGKVSDAEKYFLRAIEQGHTGAMYNLGSLYARQGKVSDAEKYFLRAIEQGDADAMQNLAALYYRENGNKAKALDFINQSMQIQPTAKGAQLQLVLQLWNGQWDNLAARVEQMLENHRYEKAELLLSELLSLEQTNLVHQLFTHPTHGPELQQRYRPLYYAVQQLSGNLSAEARLRIPPEIVDTIHNIVAAVEQRQRLYAQPASG